MPRHTAGYSGGCVDDTAGYIGIGGIRDPIKIHIPEHGVLLEGQASRAISSILLVGCIFWLVKIVETPGPCPLVKQAGALEQEAVFLNPSPLPSLSGSLPQFTLSLPSFTLYARTPGPMVAKPQTDNAGRRTEHQRRTTHKLIAVRVRSASIRSSHIAYRTISTSSGSAVPGHWQTIAVAEIYWILAFRRPGPDPQPPPRHTYNSELRLGEVGEKGLTVTEKDEGQGEGKE